MSSWSALTCPELQINCWKHIDVKCVANEIETDRIGVECRENWLLNRILYFMTLWIIYDDEAEDLAEQWQMLLYCRIFFFYLVVQQETA